MSALSTDHCPHLVRTPRGPFADQVRTDPGPQAFALMASTLADWPRATKHPAPTQAHEIQKETQ